MKSHTSVSFSGRVFGAFKVKHLHKTIYNQLTNQWQFSIAYTLLLKTDPLDKRSSRVLIGLGPWYMGHYTMANKWENQNIIKSQRFSEFLSLLLIKTIIIPLPLVGNKMIAANSVLRILLAFYHLVSKVGFWNNFKIVHKMRS